MNKPTGNVTFLFTDIEGSTKLSQEFPDTLPVALEKHHSILEEAIESNNGFIFEIVGDAFCCAFENASDAVKAAIDAQICLANEKWEDAVIKIRIGIHSGNAEWNGERYMGYITLARTARVMSAAYGEQIIISNNTYELCRYKFGEAKEKDISFRDLGERRLKDVIQPIKLLQILSKGLREDFPPLKTLDARPNNLPVQLSSFIGREKEISEIKVIIESSRLLTLLGSGGAGKTRLAMQVGADVIDDFANGVFITELATVSDPLMIAQTILNSIGEKEEQGRSPSETLVANLRDKEMLIILDNCEHLISECANLAETLLRNCSKLKIIATSREALNCTGEQTYRVPSLTLPDPSVNNSPEQLTQFESVRLFIERALAVNSHFRVNNENAPALAQICFQLDGIPLAIELAAVRIKVLSLNNICERLDNRFKLLTGGKRTSLPRQQTLKALFDWSYDLLSDHEKILWSRLSVFSSGWTLEASEEICSDEEIVKDEMLDLLDYLLEKSVIIYDTHSNRYKILETIKQYGEEKLKEANESDKILSNHLNYFMKFSESAAPKLKGNEINIWLERLEAEHTNLLSAIEWAAKVNETEKCVRLVLAMGNFWKIRSHYSTGIHILEKTISNIKEISKPSLGKLLLIFGTIYERQGELEKSKKAIEESLIIFRELKDKTYIASTLNILGNLALDRGDYEEARKFYNESLALRRELNDKRGIANCLMNLGITECDTGNYEQAQKFYEESLALNRMIEDKIGIASCLNNLGNVAYYREDHEKSDKYNIESMNLKREMGDKAGIASSLDNLADSASSRGDYEVARKYNEESLALSKEIGDKRGIATSLYHLGENNFELGNYELARKLGQESLNLRREIGEKLGIAISLESIGCMEYKQGRYDESKSLLEESLSMFRELGVKVGIASSLQHLGNVFFYKDDYRQAIKFYKEHLEIALKIEIKKNILKTLIKIAVIQNNNNHLSRSLILLGAVENTKNMFLNNSDLMMQEKLIKTLHEKLSDEEFLKYFEEGRKLTIGEVADLILNDKL